MSSPPTGTTNPSPNASGVGLSSTASTAQTGAACVVDSSDPAWKYCTMPDPTKKHSLRCNYCENVYCGGITRIKYHLGNVPKSNVVKCEKVPSDVKEEMIKLLAKKTDAKQKKAKEVEAERGTVDLSHSEGEASDDGRNAVVVLKSVKSSSSGPVDKFCRLTPEEVIKARKGKGLAEKVQSKLSTEKREEKRDRACEYICQWFYEAGIPHNAVLLPSFDLMLEAIGDFGRNLDGPSPFEMSGRFLQKRKKRVHDGLKAHKDSWELSGCTVMTDAWTDKRSRGVMNLVVHSAYGVCFLGSVDCSGARKDGKYIFDLVDKCIDDVGEHNVVQVVTDNARVNETAATLLKAKRPFIFWNGCAAHTLDLMLEDIGKLRPVDQTITKAKCLTVFLYAHTRVLDLMRKFIGKDLVRSGITRFATAYLNLKSLQDNKKELMRLFRSDELNEMGYLSKPKGKKAGQIACSETFWKGVDNAVNIFEPLAIVLRRMDSDVPAMGFLYGSLLEAKNEISARFDNDSSKFQEVFDIIDKRWDNKLKTPLHRAGYYLNPHYYYPNKLDIELDETFREAVITCITKMEADEDVQDQIMQELVLYQDADRTFGKDIAKRQWKNKHFDPAKWWLNHGTSAPKLRKLAARILGLTCSSSACERNWSAYEQVHTKRRNKLQHDRMKDLVFVKFNSRLKQKRDNKSKDPIEKAFVNILEDEDNEWITGIVPNANAEQEKEPAGSSSQGAAATSQPKRKRGVQEQHGRRKRKKLISFLDEEVHTSSSESEDEDMQLPSSPAASSDDELSGSLNLSD